MYSNIYVLTHWVALMGISSNFDFKSKHRLCPLTRDIKNQLTKVNKFYNSFLIRFTWCPAHCSIVDNEKADAAAKQTAISDRLLNNKIDSNQALSSMSESMTHLTTTS